MNWMQRMAGFGLSQSVSDQDHWFFQAFGGRTGAGVTVSEYSAMNVPAMFACVSRIADSIAQLPFHAYRRTADGGREMVTDHRVSRLLRKPNPYMNAFTFKRTHISQACLWGNGYAEQEINGRGEVVHLWPLLPDRTAMFKAQSGDALKYRTLVDGQSYELDHDMVCHVKSISPDGYTGYSMVGLMRRAIGMAIAMEVYGEKFFEGDARSGGFVQHPLTLSETAKKNLSDSLQKQGGLDNAHRIKVLEEGAKFIQTTIPQDDAQFLGSREFQISEFARVYNVPLVLLQSQSGSTVWGTGIESLMIGFVTYSLGPWIRQLEEEWTDKLFTADERDQGYYVKCTTNALLRGDMAARAAWYKAMSEISAYNGNDVRRLEDENPRDGLDTHYRPSSWVPVDGDQGGQPAAPAPSRGRNSKKVNK
jgi:HK97 family phage portal protein